MDGLHLLEAAQWVALGDQLGDGTLMQGASNQQDDVVDHVAVGYEVEKGGQRLNGLVAHVLKFDDQLFTQPIVDSGDGERRGLIGQELTVVSALQVKFQVCGERVVFNCINELNSQLCRSQCYLPRFRTGPNSGNRIA